MLKKISTILLILMSTICYGSEEVSLSKARASYEKESFESCKLLVGENAFIEEVELCANIVMTFFDIGVELGKKENAKK